MKSIAMQVIITTVEIVTLSAKSKQMLGVGNNLLQRNTEIMRFN